MGAKGWKRYFVTGGRQGEMFFFDGTTDVGAYARANYTFLWTITGARNTMNISWHYRYPGKSALSRTDEWVIEWKTRRARR